ncbi:hypothetical protein [Mesorhizobium sp.]|uniref:hypothetical protein n=1 Tax=Mesorhizobium sp. TaxID=1871066 RepID=UPI003BA8795D
MSLVRIGLLAAIVSAAPVGVAAAYTDEDSYTAVSGTAMSVTGDIQFDDFGITFANGETLKFAELVDDHFSVGGEDVPASVYRVGRPRDPQLENGNRLCGAGPVTFIASWASGESGSVIAVFTGEDAPSSDDEMCASYTYEQ